MVLALERGSPKMPPSNVRKAFHKYTDRGFKIHRNPSCWADDIHVCTKSRQCPHTTRNVEDWACLYIPFHEVGGNDGVVSKRAVSLKTLVKMRTW
jgi:hypothetical protein